MPRGRAHVRPRAVALEHDRQRRARAGPGSHRHPRREAPKAHPQGPSHHQRQHVHTGQLRGRRVPLPHAPAGAGPGAQGALGCQAQIQAGEEGVPGRTGG